MKYQVLILTLAILTGCTDNSARIIEGLEELQRETQSNLQTCQSQLDFYRKGSTTYTEQTQESAPEPSEPQYEEVDVYTLVDHRTSCLKKETVECGMSFWECDNGIIYECQRDAKYKWSTKRVEIKEEN